MYFPFALIALVLTYYFVKRFRPQLGIVIYITAFSTIFIISLGGIMLPISIYKYAKDLYQSESYNAKIVDFVYETRESDNDDDSYYEVTVKLPIVQLVTAQGDTITQKALHYNTLYSYKQEATHCKVHYNPHTGNVFVVDTDLYIMLSVMILFALFFDFLLVGVVLYVLNKDMTDYKRMISIAFFYFVIPIIILGFAILLLLAAYDQDDLPLPAKIACIVFGVLLLLVFMGYVKNFMPKSKKSHRGDRRSRPPFLVFRR